jgi:hypothetical protein
MAKGKCNDKKSFAEKQIRQKENEIV